MLSHARRVLRPPSERSLVRLLIPTDKVLDVIVAYRLELDPSLLLKSGERPYVT